MRLLSVPKPRGNTRRLGGCFDLGALDCGKTDIIAPTLWSEVSELPVLQRFTHIHIWGSATLKRVEFTWVHATCSTSLFCEHLHAFRFSI
jgi:hypothetical protein